jgi:hypothetical protein
MTARFRIFPSSFIFRKGKNFNKVSSNFSCSPDRCGGWIKGEEDDKLPFSTAEKEDMLGPRTARSPFLGAKGLFFAFPVPKNIFALRGIIR